MTEARPLLTLLARAGCHLCEDMRLALKPWSERFGFAVEEIDIRDSPELTARYGWDIPVLFAGRTELCRHFLDEKALRDWLSGQG